MSTVGYYYDSWQFKCRLKHALKAVDLTDDDKAFLARLKKHYSQYGGDCFLSNPQRHRFQILAWAGGWHPRMDRKQLKEPTTC